MRASADPGSFRDSTNRVYALEGRILRGLSALQGDHFQALSKEPFFGELIRTSRVVNTHITDPQDAPIVQTILEDGWATVVEHAVIPFVTYPYEWCFSMLRDAALLQLEILEESLEHGWTLKDASPYNIQWQGCRPTFIDTGSFEPWVQGEPWIGYRQFCSMFLVPLLLKAHLGIDYLPLLRSKLDGLPPLEARKYFQGRNRFRRGVMSHVVLPATVERSIARRERDRAPARERRAGKHTKAMVLGLVQGLKSTVSGLQWKVQHTDWSQYAANHSYESKDVEIKRAFVTRVAGSRPRKLVWDIGCNTGTFSRIAAANAQTVVALDGDHDAIEQLYRSEKTEPAKRILPLVMDLANVSPNQGWAGAERKALDARGRPGLVLCLALIHHMRVSSNVPIPLFLDWLRSLGSEVVLEFVGRQDEMFLKLLANKSVTYDDYSLESFVEACRSRYEIADRQPLKDGHRELFHLVPR